MCILEIDVYVFLHIGSTAQDSINVSINEKQVPDDSTDDQPLPLKKRRIKCADDNTAVQCEYDTS